MDDLKRLLNDVETLMELQIQGMDEFQDNQLQAKNALEEKNWFNLERCLKALDFKAEGLRCVEERRAVAWNSIMNHVLNREGTFYEILPRLPSEHREKISDLHKELKIRSLRLRGMTLGLSAYIQTASTLIKAVVQEMNPTLRGRLYSKNGFLRQGESQPLVLNTHL